jgi:hypothetical protein
VTSAGTARVHSRNLDEVGDGLTIPRKLWAAPLPEAQWVGTPPRLTLRVLLLPLVALVSAYVSAAAASRGHLVAAGWLLGLAVTALAALAATIIRHGCRAARHRREAPR